MDEPPKPVVQYITGLDLGQAQDFTALAVVERTLTADPRDTTRNVARYAVRHLRRWPRGTPYTSVIDDVGEMFAAAPLKGSALAVDGTGVGRAVLDLIRRARLACQLVPIVITGGHAVTREPDGSLHVAKKHLVGVLQVLLQARRLRVAKALPEAEKLTQELQSFRVKITAAANETFEAWRDGDHDDLVLAVALAAWYGESIPQPYTGPLLVWPDPDLMPGKTFTFHGVGGDMEIPIDDEPEW